MGLLSKIIDKADGISEKRLFLINFCLGALLFSANILTFGSTDFSALDETAAISPFTLVSLPLAALVILSSPLARQKKGLESKTGFNDKLLLFHTILFLAGALAALYYVISVLLSGIPEDDSFSWVLGIFTFSWVYPTYLLRRTLFREKISTFGAIRYLHLIVFIIAFSLDIGVVYKINESISQYQKGTQYI